MKMRRRTGTGGNRCSLRVFVCQQIFSQKNASARNASVHDDAAVILLQQFFCVEIFFAGKNILPRGRFCAGQNRRNFSARQSGARSIRCGVIDISERERLLLLHSGPGMQPVWKSVLLQH